MKHFINLRNLKKLAFAFLSLAVVGLAIPPMAEYFSINHADPVAVDSSYEHIFQGNRALKANSYTGSVYSSNLTYVLNDSGEACVSVGARMSGYDDMVIPAYYSDGTDTYTVVAIDYSGFANYEYLRSVAFENPDLIRLIDSQAFASCPNLRSFNSDVAGTFMMPRNITSIPSACFMRDLALTSLEFSDSSITQIKDNAFNACKNLAKNIIFNVSSAGLTIGDSAFANCTSLPNLILPAKVTSIGAYSFYNCTSLKMIFIPSTCINIGKSAFRFDTNATAYITYPTKYPSGNNGTVDWAWPTDGNDSASTPEDWNYATNAKEIPVNLNQSNINIDPDSLFFYTFNWDSAYSLYRITVIKYIGSNNAEVEIPQTLPVSGDGTNISAISTSSGQQLGVVTEIGSYCFVNDNTINTLTFPNTIENISDHCMSNCTEVSSLTLGDIHSSNTGSSSYPNGSAFYIYGEPNILAMGDYGLTGLSSIGNYSFSDGSGLDELDNCSSLTIPSTVVSIGENAFRGAKGATSLTFNVYNDIPVLTSIGANAFSYLGSLKTTPIDLVIPGSIKTIGSGAFANITYLNSVTFGNTARTADFLSISQSIFSGASRIKYVILGNSVKNVYNNAFSANADLEWIYLSSNTTTVQSSAFPKESTNMTFYLGSSGTPSGYSGGWNQMSYNYSVVAESNGGYFTDTSGIDTKVTTDYQPVYYSVEFPMTVSGALTSSTFTEVADNTLVTDDYLGIQYIYSSSGSVLSNYLDYDNKAAIDASSSYANITSVGQKAFFSQYTVTSVILPDSVTSIGDFAFAKTNSLTRVSTAINNYNLPASLNAIGDYAFTNTAISSVSLGSSVTSIGTWAFYMNPQMTSLYIDPNNQYYAGDSKYAALYSKAVSGWNTTYILEYITGTTALSDKTYTILSGTTEIRKFAVASVATGAMTKLTIPTSVTTIDDFGLCMSAGGGSDYWRCRASITEIIFDNYQNSLCSSIGVYAFGYQQVLASTAATALQLPDNSSIDLLIIKQKAFRYCKNLYTVEFPVNGTMVDDDGNTTSYYTLAQMAFDQCDKLHSIIIPSCITEIGFATFWGARALQSVTLDGILSIGREAFCNCSSLGSVTFPSTLKVIEQSAFSGCSGSNFTSIDLYYCTALTSIGSSAFSGCSNVTEINILNCYSLNTIYSSCFSNCTKVTAITFSNDSALTTIDASVFNNCKALQTVSLSGCTALTTLGSSLFKDCTALTTVDLSRCNRITRIPDYMFQNDSSLNYVNIYGCTALTTIGVGAFQNSGLKHIYSDTVRSRTEGLNLVYGLGYTNHLVTISNSAFAYSSLQTVDLNSSALTTIDYSAFYDCTSLTRVYLARKVTVISLYCFQYCSSLAEVNFSTNTQIQYMQNYCFAGTAFTSVSLTSNTNLINIQEGAFSGCSALTSFTVSGVTKLSAIGNQAFSNCSQLTSVNLSNCYGINSIGDYAFSGDSKITIINLTNCNSLNTIGNYCFTGCTLLKQSTTTESNGFVVPDSVTSIGTYCFNNCTSLVRFTCNATGSDLYSIPDGCFYNCSALTTVALANATASIGTSAFLNCSSLTTLTSDIYSSQLNTIGNTCFYNCSNLVTIAIPNAVRTIGSSCFQGCSRLAYFTTTSSSALTTLGDYCFINCSSIVNFSLPNSVTALGTSCFAGCSRLVKFEMNYLSSKLAKIPANCFSGCTALAKSTDNTLNGNTVLYIPASVTLIDNSAFENCTSLRYLFISSSVCLGTGASQYIFTNDSNLMLVSGLTYDADGYTQFYPVANKWWTNSIYVNSTTKVKMYFYHSSGSLTAAERNNVYNGNIAGYWTGSQSNISFIY